MRRNAVESVSRRRLRSRRWLIVSIAALVLVGGAFVLVAEPGPLDFAGRHGTSIDTASIDPSGVPRLLKNASLVERGRYLARAADCVACHTAPDGAPFAGGRAFVLPFGTLYSTNITPDAETGIGRYSDHDFLKAIHEGIRPDSQKLYPAMPYTSYAYMTDADALAIKAYLSSLQPVHAPARANTLSFPFDQRSLLSPWSAFFRANERFAVNLDRDAQWNRGAYLAEAIAHCGECHTPRTAAFALNNGRKFGGEVQDGWNAYNVSSDPDSGIGAWSRQDLVSYLSAGHARGHGTSNGPMGEVLTRSLQYLAPEDIEAIAVYVQSVPPVRSAHLEAVRPTPRESLPPTGDAAHGVGALVFAASCAGCHDWSGDNPALAFASLVGSRAVNDPTARNVIAIILRGGTRHPGENSSVMPAFGETYSDAEVAGVANFVTARFGGVASRATAADVARARRLGPSE